MEGIVPVFHPNSGWYRRPASASPGSAADVADHFKKALGLDERDHVAGFIYIGTTTEQPEERPRPDLAEIVTHWRPGLALNNGASYGQPGTGFPEAGFDLDKLTS